jgi:dCTP deaminase
VKKVGEKIERKLELKEVFARNETDYSLRSKDENRVYKTLSDTKILESMDNGEIVIKPFNRDYLSTSSYDVHLSKYLAVYKESELDVKKHNEIERFEIPEEGFVLEPGELYLASTVECTGSKKHMMVLEGKSSMGRLGVEVNTVAGTGDVGFKGH